MGRKVTNWGAVCPPNPPRIFLNRKSNGVLTVLRQDKPTVQAGTPMTVTGKGTLSHVLGQGADRSFFCSKISRGPGQRPGYLLCRAVLG